MTVRPRKLGEEELRQYQQVVVETIPPGVWRELATHRSDPKDAKIDAVFERRTPTTTFEIEGPDCFQKAEAFMHALKELAFNHYHQPADAVSHHEHKDALCVCSYMYERHPEFDPHSEHYDGSTNISNVATIALTRAKAQVLDLIPSDYFLQQAEDVLHEVRATLLTKDPADYERENPDFANFMRVMEQIDGNPAVLRAIVKRAHDDVNLHLADSEQEEANLPQVFEALHALHERLERTDAQERPIGGLIPTLRQRIERGGIENSAENQALATAEAILSGLKKAEALEGNLQLFHVGPYHGKAVAGEGAGPKF